jgi:hypothetical protein
MVGPVLVCPLFTNAGGCTRDSLKNTNKHNNLESTKFTKTSLLVL